MLNYRQQKAGQKKIGYASLMAMLRLIVVVGIRDKGRMEYWKFFIWTLFRRPALFSDAMTFAVYGYHFRTVFGLRNNRYV